MLFAVPVALLSAFYTYESTSTRLKSIVQPAIELVASVPGVVIGFLAAVWLAPHLEQVLVTIFLMVIIMPTAIFGAALLWRFGPKPTRDRVSAELILVPVGALIFVSVIVSQLLSRPIEDALFGGDVIQWLSQTLGMNYENRNAIIVGFALGLAVTPPIYTRAYHALVNVPQGLVSDALALGATRTQVALSVVLPTAGPGIFIAIMVGFSRAVGETMIVLLASNNTPIFDWHIFSGMQTMSAAIAGIMPAIPRGETLYRVLFLIGGLLFLFTFVINVLSDVISAYLRKRYH
jgi:phosphate transport system permease protein